MDTCSRIKHLRLFNGESIADLADAIGAHYTTVHHWETMEGRKPSTKMMVRLLSHYKLSISDFYALKINAKAVRRG